MAYTLKLRSFFSLRKAKFTHQIEGDMLGIAQKWSESPWMVGKILMNLGVIVRRDAPEFSDGVLMTSDFYYSDIDEF